MSNLDRPMKWWGWGLEHFSPDYSDKPYLWPYICEQLDWPSRPSPLPPPSLDNIKLPPKRDCAGFVALLGEASTRFLDDDKQRLLHCAGKSFRDLWQARNGVIAQAPDGVFFPRDESEVLQAVAAAHQNDVILIPFGGGSNITGCVSPPAHGDRPVVSLDLTMLDRVLEVDSSSMLARVQAGVMGESLELQLNERGVTLGHFPDSFLHSTLGGWIATRSAGMQSDHYGNIEDLLLSLRLASPSGVVETSAVPRSSAGPAVKELCLGSEGALGVITEATVIVRRLPPRKDFYGYVFPTFAAGVAALQEAAQSGRLPLLSRLNDPKRTALSLAFRAQSTGAARLLSGMVRRLVALRGINFSNCCLLIAAFEGDRREFARQRRDAETVYRRHGGVSLGTSPGRSFARNKYDFPHLRDYFWEHGIYADVSETSIVWEKLPAYYQQVLDRAQDAFKTLDVVGWIGCHISHTYRSGACLYFTFGFRNREQHVEDTEVLRRYLFIKRAIQDAFIAGGGTMSHHHAVGAEHAPWLNAELGEHALAAFAGAKHSLDPRGVMNPERLRAVSYSDWGLKD